MFEKSVSFSLTCSAKAKEKIHDIYMAPTRQQALVAYNAEHVNENETLFSNI